MIRRGATMLAALCFLLAATTVRAAAPRNTGSTAAFLLDARTGTVLYQRNAGARVYPASTTKLLTALVAVEHGELDQLITVSDRAARQAWDSSLCWVSAGEQVALEDLLYGLLLASGNDCAEALADGLTDGHREQFMTWMNETARRLGATDSHFTNPHGLHSPNHYTTARDLALIARGSLADDTVARISSTRYYKAPHNPDREYYNHNNLLNSYDGAAGGKTGWTESARFCLVASVQRNGRHLIAAVMGHAQKQGLYREIRSLFDHGLTDFEQHRVVAVGQPAGVARVAQGQHRVVRGVAAEEVVVTLPKGAAVRSTVTRALVEAPVARGETVGLLTVRVNGQVYITVELLAAGDVPPWGPLLPDENLLARHQRGLDVQVLIQQ